MHIHSARLWFGWVLGLGAVLTPLALADPLGPAMGPAGLAPVTGRVNLEGHPLGHVMICFDSGDHAAQGWLGADGSFSLHSHGRGEGVAPGKYRVHIFPNPGGWSLPAKYRDPGTSGLDVEVAPDWNDYSFDLR